MKNLLLLLVLFLFCSFRPTPTSPKDVPAPAPVSSNGYYVFVQDYTSRTNHKYIVESKDSVNTIFSAFLHSELELGEVDRPISIFNGKVDFYVARVNVFEQPNGKKSFKHLKYPNVYSKRSKLKPVTL